MNNTYKSLYIIDRVMKTIDDNSAYIKVKQLSQEYVAQNFPKPFKFFTKKEIEKGAQYVIEKLKDN